MSHANGFVGDSLLSEDFFGFFQVNAGLESMFLEYVQTVGAAD